MLIHLLSVLSICTKSPIPLEIGKNTVSLSANQHIIINNINPQTFFIFSPPISPGIEITAESNGVIIGKINDENVGVHFGINSGSITIRNSGSKSSMQSLTFYFLTSNSNAAKYFISTYQEDAFVISHTASFSSCRSYSIHSPIEYWHVTGIPQKLVSSSVNENPENTVLYKYDNIHENKIRAKSTDTVTLSSSNLIYFLWDSNVNAKKGTYKITIHPDTVDSETRTISLPQFRYAFKKGSKTSLLAINHNYGDYDMLKKQGKPIPLNQISSDDTDTTNKVIRFSFDSSAITILLTLIGIIVILLAILIYVGLMPVPSSSAILSSKPHNDEESLLKDSDKSPELAAFLRSNK